MDTGVIRALVVFASLSLFPLVAQEIPAAHTCLLCHRELGEKGAQGQYPLWQKSVMASAAKDPYWLAKVKEEVGTFPQMKSLVEDKCLSCHAPAQHYSRRVEGGKLALDSLAARGREGVSCPICHMMDATNLGQPSSFTGGFVINTRGAAYGPHEDPFQMPMLHHTGLTAMRGEHTLKAELCATCHTVITPTFDARGKVAGDFLEQAPYLEWAASAYGAAGTTCQSCHVPQLEKAEYIAHRPPGGPFPPTRPRKPFGLHLFSGANTLLPKLTGDGDAARAADFLSGAAALRVQGAWRGDALEASVVVTNLAGHKLPTGFPSRRMWLHVTVRDAAGRTVFESGAGEPGSQPHRTVITEASQAQVYETEMADTEGKPTTLLLRAARYVKDNRILPDGFDFLRADRRTLPAGVAGDEDFAAGSDRTRYLVKGIPRGKYSVQAELHYQTLKPAHAGVLDPAQYAAHGGSLRIAVAAAEVQDLRASHAVIAGQSSKGH